MLHILQRGVLLSDHSTFGIGGEAHFFISCRTIDELVQAVNFSEENQVPMLLIGQGSNCLFPDEGFPGLVLHNALSSFTDDGHGFLIVGAGYSFSRLGVETANKGWSGLEFAAGIPGSVGGAVFMNAGACGQETSQTLQFVDVFENGSIKRLPKEALSFGYRFSSLQDKKGVVVAAGFLLKKDEAASLRQRELLAHRRKTQPYSERSAGCVFRNPPGHSAGRLIEEVGLKGVRIGGAEISNVHANFIVNKGQARASDVKSLIQLVQTTVLEKKNMSLACEVRVI